MSIAIKSIVGKIIATVEDAKTTREAVELHSKSGGSLLSADLSGANLSRANLYGADLSGADLSGANLSRANLSRANLSRADLSEADLSRVDLNEANLSRANLSRANLSRADLYGADLSGADLSGANLSRANLYGADLSGADLSGANLSRANLGDLPYDIPIIPSLNRQMLAAIEAGGSLLQSDWHTCETTHCRAGWAIHLAGQRGSNLERQLGSSVAGALIHLVSCPQLNGIVPNWYASDKDALNDIKRLAELEPVLSYEHHN